MLKRLAKYLHALRREEEATTSIEFAIVSMPFVILSVGIIEISMMFTAGTLLEGGVTDAARLIRTGQVQQAGASAETIFRDELCGTVSLMVDCGNLNYEVVSFSSSSFFDAATVNAQFDGDGNFQPRGFDPGGVSDVVLVRVVYEYPLATPLIGQLLTGDGTQTMMSTIIFQTEPYEFVTP